MRVGTVVQETGRSLRDILRALDQRITAEDNLAPDGEAGQVLTSNGPNEPPTWQDIPSVAPSPSGVDGTGVAGALAVWLDADTLSDSIVTQAGSLITVGGSIGVDVDAAITGTLAVTGAVDFDATLDVAGAVVFQSASLSINGLAYTWPGSQAVNRVLRNTGPGTLAWSQIDLTTDITGIIPSANVSGDYPNITGVGTLVSGAVPASLVTAGTFGAGSYTFPANLALTGTLTGVTTITTSGAINGQTISSAASFTGSLTTSGAIVVGTGVGSQVLTLREGGANTHSYLAWVTSGSVRKGYFGFPSNSATAISLTNEVTNGGITLTPNGTGVITLTGPVTGVTTLATSGAINGQTISSAASFTGTVAVASTLNVTGNLNALAAGNTFGTSAGVSQTVVLNSAATGNRVISWRSAGTARWNFFATGTTELLNLQALDSGGSIIDSPLTIANAAGGTIAFSSARPITGGTYNGQTISSAASFTGSLSTAGALNINSTGTSLNVGTAAGGAVTGINIRAAASIQRDFIFSSGTTAVWTMRVQGTESGGDAGASLNFIARTDAGAIIDVPLSITRAAGGTIAFSSGRPVTMGSSLAITGALSGVTTLAISSDVTYSDSSWLLSPNTVDGADTSRAFFSAGGGTASVGRGAYVGVSGNENATSPGILFLVAGDTGFIRTLGNFIPNNDGADDLGSASFQYNRLYLDNQLISSLATGTAPFVVASTTKVANLNADLLDDQTGSYYLDLANATGTLDETLGGTGLTSYTLGDLLYASAANTLSKLAGNTSTTGMYLKQTGTGAASAAPVWDTLTAADVGAGTFPASADYTFQALATFTGRYVLLGGSLVSAGVVVNVTKPTNYTPTESIQIGQFIDYQATSSATTELGGLSVRVVTANASYTTTDAIAIRIYSGTKGAAGANITNLYGLKIENQTVGSTNYAIYTGTGAVHFGDDVNVASGKVYKVNGTQVVAAQGAAVADATGAGDVVAQLNALLARIRAHGLIAT